MFFKKFTVLLILALALSFNTASAKSEKECFEKVNEGSLNLIKVSIIILKPTPKGYNKLPEPIKKGKILHLI